MAVIIVADDALHGSGEPEVLVDAACRVESGIDEGDEPLGRLRDGRGDGVPLMLDVNGERIASGRTLSPESGGERPELALVSDVADKR